MVLNTFDISGSSAGVMTALFVQPQHRGQSARDASVIMFDALNYAVTSSLDGQK